MATLTSQFSGGQSDVQNSGNALVVFCRAPRLGEVKTRLAAAVGAPIALQIYRAMLRDCFDWAAAIAPAVTILACFTPEDALEDALDDADGLAALWSGDAMPQRGVDLGARMLNALADARARGFERSVIIGSDAPDLPPDYGRRAFGLLAENDVVVGPSRDGGFVLIGAARPLPGAVFAGITWSRDDVCARLLDNLRNLQLSYALLEPWHDVDEFADLQALRARLQNGEVTANATRAALGI